MKKFIVIITKQPKICWEDTRVIEFLTKEEARNFALKCKKEYTEMYDFDINKMPVIELGEVETV